MIEAWIGVEMGVGRAFDRQIKPARQRAAQRYVAHGECFAGHITVVSEMAVEQIHGGGDLLREVGDQRQIALFRSGPHQVPENRLQVGPHGCRVPIHPAVSVSVLLRIGRAQAAQTVFSRQVAHDGV